MQSHSQLQQQMKVHLLGSTDISLFSSFGKVNKIPCLFGTDLQVL